MADGIQSRAADYADRSFQEQQQGLFDAHRQQEQRELNRRKIELKSFTRQHDEIGRGYDTRLKSIEEKRQRIQDAMERRHNSVGGKLQAMTKKGRERQRDELERLNDRAELLNRRAYNRYFQTTDRVWQAEQKARIGHAREMRVLREQHVQDRQHHAQRFQQSRERQIDDRAQTLRQIAERQWQQAMNQDRQQASERSHSRTH